MSLVEINAQEAEKKLQVVTKFHMLILCIVFGSAIFYQFVIIMNLQRDFRNYVISGSSQQTEKITENTAVLRDIKGVLLQNQELLKDNKK